MGHRSIRAAGLSRSKVSGASATQQQQRGVLSFRVSAGGPAQRSPTTRRPRNFTAGNIVTGATSGATARIPPTRRGATGTLTLQDVVGTFVDNEIITDGATGSATVNGALSTSTRAGRHGHDPRRAGDRRHLGRHLRRQRPGDRAARHRRHRQTIEWTVDVTWCRPNG
jgi:hypothetical protein